MKMCSEKDCWRTHYAKGLCHYHYNKDFYTANAERWLKRKAYMRDYLREWGKKRKEEWIELKKQRGEEMKMSIDMDRLNQEQRNALARVLMNDTQPMPEAKPEKERKHRKGALVVDRIKGMKIGEFEDLNTFMKSIPNSHLTTIAYLCKLANEGIINIRISKVDAMSEELVEELSFHNGKRKHIFKHKSGGEGVGANWDSIIDY